MTVTQLTLMKRTLLIEECSGAEESQESENDTDSGSDESTNSDSENTTTLGTIPT